MSALKIAGKNPSGEVTGVLVNADGNLVTAKKWQNEQVEILNSEIRSTSKVRATMLDLSDVAAVSLRIHNTTGKSFVLSFDTDAYPTHTYVLNDVSGAQIQYPVTSVIHSILTPDDVHILQWLRYLKVAVKFDTAPTEGSLIIYAVVKR